MNAKTLNPEQLRKVDAYWRAANYLSVGQIYLYDNLFKVWIDHGWEGHSATKGTK